MIALVLATLVAAIHFFFLYLEMFNWEAPRTLTVFNMTPEQASETKTLAANIGLYNGLIGASVLFAAWSGATAMLVFLLCCVIVAGIYGAMTATFRAFIAQGIPASLALAAIATGI